METTLTTRKEVRLAFWNSKNFELSVGTKLYSKYTNGLGEEKLLLMDYKTRENFEYLDFVEFLSEMDNDMREEGKRLEGLGEESTMLFELKKD